jgi:hypothetical protein
MESSERERQYIVNYTASQASDETVEHLEKVASERVLGRDIDVWDVHTNIDRWWIITAPTNLYSQEQFPSMDVALSFHLGLTARVMERSERAAPDEQAEHFPIAWRKWEQAGEALNKANEAEDFQAVGMRCRESLIAFAREASSVVKLDDKAPLVKASDFKGWSELIANTIAAGASAKRRRNYLKSAAKSTWEFVNWLTHADTATRFDSYFAFQATGHVLSSWSLSLLRFEHGDQDRCPRCGSYKLTIDYRHDDDRGTIQVIICEACQWESNPTLIEEDREDVSSVNHVPATDPQDLGSYIFVDVPLRGPVPPKPSI